MAASGRSWDAVATALAATLLILPLWCVAAPAMPDYPAHLASYYLIGGGAKAASVARFYAIDWAFLPNLAGEAIVPLLGRITGLEVAARLFLSAGVAMWVVGPALIHRALVGRIGPTPLFAAVFAYNANFMWGFLNYCFAAGLALVVFAGWIASETDRGRWRIAGFALAILAVYFSHLFAAATLLLLILGYEAQAAWREPRTALARALSVAMAFVPAGLAYLLLKPRDAGGDSGIAFNLLDTWDDRLGAAIQRNYDAPSYVLLGALMFLLGIAVWRGWAKFDRRMLVVLVLVLGAAVFAPEWAMGGWGVDLRLPAVLGALLFASVEIDLARRGRLALGAVALALLAFNAAMLARSWLPYDRQFAEFRLAAKELPPGARLLTVLDGDAIGLRSDQPYWHMAEFAIIDPGALTQLLFTTPNQHVVRLRPPYQLYAAASAEQGSPPDISELGDLAAGRTNEDVDIETVFPYLMRFQCHYDEAVVIHLDGKRSPVPDMLTLRHAGSFFSIYDIRQTPACPKA